MAQMVFINLPVKDLPASTAFFTELGFEKSAQFSDENASSLMISDTIVVILLATPFFSTLTSKKVADSADSITSIVGLGRDSRKDVDTLVDAAIAAGAKEARDTQDYGFM